jgi:transposase
MSKKGDTRHNAEFVRLWRKSGMAQRDVANALGVSLITVKSWCVDENAEMFRVCPKWRLDAFKIVLGIKLPDLTAKQREEVLSMLREFR